MASHLALKGTTWLIVGCGYTGARLAKRLLGAGARVVGTRRTPQSAGELATELPELEVLVSSKNALVDCPLQRPIVVDCAPPSEEGSERDMVRSLVRMDARRLVYLSSTGVYAAGNGQWVDEDHPAEPIGARGVARLRAETEVLQTAKALSLPCCALRLPAIYGPKRGLHARLQDPKYKPVLLDSYVSRIHVDDLVKAIVLASLAPSLEHDVYNLGDDAPSTLREHVCGVAEMMHVEIGDTRRVSDLPKSTQAMFGANRKISNRRAKRAFGFELDFPSWREGVANVLGV